jgi:hypothetical protein
MAHERCVRFLGWSATSCYCCSCRGGWGGGFLERPSAQLYMWQVIACMLSPGGSDLCWTGHQDWWYAMAQQPCFLIRCNTFTLPLPPAVVVVLSKAFFSKRYPMEELQLLLHWRDAAHQAGTTSATCCCLCCTTCATRSPKHSPSCTGGQQLVRCRRGRCAGRHGLRMLTSWGSGQSSWRSWEASRACGETR